MTPRSLSALALLCAAGLSAQELSPDKRLRSAADVFHDVMATPDKAIPRNLFERAQCIVIVPGMKKGAFLVGGDYGKGYAVCRHGGVWGGPDPVAMSGGSFGLQLGVDSTDVILLIMNDRGLNHLLADKFQIGGDASAAAGPVGRDANADTDLSLRAEILSWSRTHGLFAGISLNGTVIAHDKGETKKLYGREEPTEGIVRGRIPPPPGARVLIAELDRFGPKK